MAYEELIHSMEMDAALRVQEVRTTTQAFVDATLETARGQADEVCAGHLAETERRIGVERHQRLYRAREEVKASLARVREEHLQRALAATREELARQRDQVGYPDVLERLVREALEALGEDAGRVHVDPRDEALVRALFASQPDGPLVKPDLKTAGGVTVDSVDGRILVDNTFDSRLVRAGEVYRRELFDRLNGGP